MGISFLEVWQLGGDEFAFGVLYYSSQVHLVIQDLVRTLPLLYVSLPSDRAFRFYTVGLL